MILYTIGYEGRSADDLPCCFEEAGVTRVVDVRELPISRKRGLSKSALSQQLDAHGLGYVHERRLGNPKPLRDWVKSGGDWDQFAQVFRARLGTADAALDAVRAFVAPGEPVCLLCYEADPSRGHRSLVAEALVGRAAGLQVKHL